MTITAISILIPLHAVGFQVDMFGSKISNPGAGGHSYSVKSPQYNAAFNVYEMHDDHIHTRRFVFDGKTFTEQLKP